MFLILRKSLVSFLLVLQFFAPLVHAHIGVPTSGVFFQSQSEIHLPGLEIYAANLDLHAIKAISTPSTVEGFVIGVDAGINDLSDNDFDDADQIYFLSQQSLILNTPYSPFDSNFSPQDEQFVSCLLLHVISPRAPPAL